MARTLSVWMKWICACTGGNCGFLSLHYIVSSGENVGEISGQLSHQEQRVDHHLQESCEKAELDRLIGHSVIHQYNTPTHWKRISFTFWIASSFDFLICHNFIESIFFHTPFFFSIWTQNLLMSKIKPNMLFFLFRKNFTYVHQHLPNIDMGRGSCFFPALLAVSPWLL